MAKKQIIANLYSLSTVCSRKYKKKKNRSSLSQYTVMEKTFCFCQEQFYSAIAVSIAFPIIIIIQFD